MRRQQGISPVLLELLVVVLFFAICAGINLQVLAKANALSRQSERQSAALLSASGLCEQLRHDPTAFGAFDGTGLCSFEREEAGITLRASIRRSGAGAGLYYEYSVLALDGEEEIAAFHGGSYRREEGP